MKRARCLVLCFLLGVVSRQCYGEKFSELPVAKTEVSEEAAYQKWLEMETSLKSTIENLIKQAFPTLLRMSSESNVSSQCTGSMMKIIFGIRDMKLWPFQMIDATGKPGAGLLSGNPSSFGAFHQCLDVIIPSRAGSTIAPKTGKYCIIRIRPPLPPRPNRIEVFKPVFRRVNATFKTEVITEFVDQLFIFYDVPLKFGICLPSSCSEDDVVELVAPVLSQIGMNVQVESCEVKEPVKVNKLQLIVISIAASFVCACLLATLIVEYKEKYNENKDEKSKSNRSYLYQLLVSFSMVKNIEKLVTTKPAQKHSLDCVNGLRYISATWIVLGHAYLIYDRYSFREGIYAKEYFKDPLLSAISNAFMAVESFFFISATLASYIIVKTYDSKHSYHPFIALIRRILRLTPGTILTIGFYFILPLLASGPNYKTTSEDVADMCTINWWQNILFIGNFVPLLQQCVTHSWFIAVDMQCFIVALFYFYLLFRNAKLGQMFLALMIGGGVITSGIITYLYEYPPATTLQYLDLRHIAEYAQMVYYQPHVHIGVYGVGLFIGTFMARNPKLRITKWQAALGWISATVIGITVVYGVHPWNNRVPYSRVEAIMFSATQRTVWGVCCAWVVFACYVGKGGYVNSFLSWPAFQPLVKLTYLLYWLHLPIYIIIGFSKHGNQEYTHKVFVYYFFGTLCISQILTLIVRVFYEAPLIEIERVFWSWLFSNKTEEKITAKESNGVKNMPVIDEKDEIAYMKSNSKNSTANTPL